MRLPAFWAASVAASLAIGVAVGALVQRRAADAQLAEAVRMLRENQRGVSECRETISALRSPHR